jgi:hypothetical protein
LAAAVCAGMAGVLLVVAIFLNEGALSAENNLPSDDAFGPYVFGILFAAVACATAVRVQRGPSRAGVAPAVVLSLVAGVVAVIGAVLAIGEPAAFNAGYGCLGSSGAWLAIATKPSPSTCGYVIPSADTALFYPSAFSAIGAAVLAAACALLMLAGRMRRST